MLTVKAVLALDHARMQGQSQVPGSSDQAAGHIIVRHRRELQRRIFKTGMLKPHGAGGHHDVPGLDGKVNAAAGARADEGIRAALVQLLHGDGRGGSADAGGAGRDLLPQQRSGPDIILPVACHLPGIVKQRRNGRHPSRVAGQDAVAPHILTGAGDMILPFQFLHTDHLFKN